MPIALSGRINLSNIPVGWKCLASLVTLAATLCPWTPSVGAEPIPYPKPLQTIMDRGVSVVRSFPAPGGLTGWVIKRDNRQMIVYTTSDKQNLLVGDLLDELGHDMTARYASMYASKPDIDSLYKQLERARYISDGAASVKSPIYVFMDPNCVFCHFAWLALRPYVKAGVQVRWIPVSVVKSSSAPRAAAILTSQSPVKALEYNESHFVLSSEDGGVSPAPKVDPTIIHSLEANRSLMDAFGVNGTPAFVWKSADGKVQAKAGMPPLSELPGITSLPEQPEPDHELDRFR